MNERLRFVPLHQLRTTLAPLRGPRTQRASSLTPLPLRVAPVGPETYEVLDGFKRLAQWRENGEAVVPVVVEDASGLLLKSKLLEANCPRKTLSPMDEARVVRSLVEEDGLSPAAASKLLGRRLRWTERRLALARRLAPPLGARLDAGRLSFTVALDLAAFPKSEQTRLALAIERHGLPTRAAQAFLATYRVAPEGPARQALLTDPGGVRPPPADPSPLGPTAADLERRFDQAERLLEELSRLDLSGFLDPERRVLEARRRRLDAQIRTLALQKGGVRS